VTFSKNLRDSTLRFLLKKVLTSKFFSFPGVVQTFYFLLIFVLTQILWLPFGTVVVFVLVFIQGPGGLLEFLNIDVMKIVDSSSMGMFIYFVFLRLSILFPMFLFSYWILKKLNQLREKSEKLWILAIIAASSCFLSLQYFFYSIRDWWFLN